MQEKIKQKHGTLKMFALNLLLLGAAGALLIRLMALVIYTMLPNSYFLDIENITVTGVQDVCGEQIIEAEGVRYIYPYLGASIAESRAIPASLTVEVFKSNGHKVDDLQRHPVIEWVPEGKTSTEWNFNTTLLPGTYYVELTTFIRLPIVGEREEPLRIRSNIFTVPKCNK